MRKYRLFTIPIIFSSFALLLVGCSDTNNASQKKQQSADQTAFHIDLQDQWNKNKLSMFVHFGVYSTLGGEWKNKSIEGSAENIWAESGIFADEYEQIASDFAPKKWNPSELVALARDIGAKNIIFTVKHHDGFCLFNTETTSFNIIDFTTFDHDLLAEMASACKNANIGLGINFSLTDWHLPAAWPMSSHFGAPVTDAHHQNNLHQIKELLTNYGDISTIYFYSGLLTPIQSRELRQLIKEIQPECLISNGIGNNMGDFIAAPFNQPIDINLNVPWLQRSSSFPPSLGYKENHKSTDILEVAQHKIRELVKVISSGGNYALNVAPQGDGSLDQTEKEILNHMGRWIKVNRRAIFQTNGNPLGSSSAFCSATWKDNHLYLFVDSVPSSQKITFSGFENKIEEVSFLGSGIKPDFFSRGDRHEITWTSPAMADPMKLPVLEVIMKETIQPATEKKRLLANPVDTIILNLNNSSPIKSIAGMDQLSSIPSNTALRWNLDVRHKPTALLKFTPQEVGRTLKIKTDSSETVETLKGKPGNLIRSKNDTIQTGQIFRSKPFYGAMKELHVNPNGSNRLQVSHSSWMANPRQKAEIMPLPLTHLYYYVEIDSENPQQYCYRITGNDGIQVWLNKKEVLHTITHPEKPLTFEIVLDLQKGKNTLLIKNFNRRGKKDYFSLTPLPDVKWLTQSVEIPKNPGFIEIRDQNSTNIHTDINIPNFSIELMPEN